MRVTLHRAAERVSVPRDRKSCQLLEAWAPKVAHFPSAIFYSSKKSQRPPRSKGVGQEPRLSSLNGRSVKAVVASLNLPPRLSAGYHERCCSVREQVIRVWLFCSLIPSSGLSPDFRADFPVSPNYWKNSAGPWNGGDCNGGDQSRDAESGQYKICSQEVMWAGSEIHERRHTKGEGEEEGTIGSCREGWTFDMVWILSSF